VCWCSAPLHSISWGSLYNKPALSASLHSSQKRHTNDKGCGAIVGYNSDDTQSDSDSTIRSAYKFAGVGKKMHEVQMLEVGFDLRVESSSVAILERPL